MAENLNTDSFDPMGIQLPRHEDLALKDVLTHLLTRLEWDEQREERVRARAAQLITQIRAMPANHGEVENFLKSYGLNSPEGRALLTLSESLLRIPDALTQDALIEEKLSVSDWKGVGGENFFMKSAGVGLGIAKSVLGMGGLAGGILNSLGKPVIRKAMKESVRRMGGQFVIGEQIDSALKNAAELAKDGLVCCSFDMLGEGARSHDDARKYFESYKTALMKIGERQGAQAPITHRHSISVKLSALHPRYDWAHADLCIPPMVEKLLELMTLAATYNIALTVDAEESERLELSLKIMLRALAQCPHKNWHGFGLAVQAYDRRCLNVLETIVQHARQSGRKIQIRLVKGAYWDGEIKRAQMAGWADYAVFQRKSQTDLSYLTAAQFMIKNRDVIYPMFATHNAYTAAAILDFVAQQKFDPDSFEFQRLYGMGAALGDLLTAQEHCRVRLYAPVGAYEDLLPYLVRRMLENGANASFVAHLRDDRIPIDRLTMSPVARVRGESNPEPLPRPPFLLKSQGDMRPNSAGIDLSRTRTRNEFFTQLDAAKTEMAQDYSAPNSAAYSGVSSGDSGPKSDSPPTVKNAQSEIAELIIAAQKNFTHWNGLGANARADILDRAADLIESDRAALTILLQQEGKKTLSDALAEIREAVDFLRYYAAQGRVIFAAKNLPGPTGERNQLELTGRGVFVCISPWNFPLAIFIGQVAASLMAGNSVLAKPAEQTPHIAARAVKWLHEAGVPRNNLILIQGDGEVGAGLVSAPQISGVAFTGSNEAAWQIARSLSDQAHKNAAALPVFIAETGGQNAMIVDSTALPEQVVDDVILSSFGSAGQRCSALRVLYLQDDTADHIITLLRGAMETLVVGPAEQPATDVAEVIDQPAAQKLLDHIAKLDRTAKKIAGGRVSLHGCYIAPCAYEISSIGELEGEVFGPVLHVIRYSATGPDGGLNRVIEEINSTGYGLTFGIHSRLQSRIDHVCARVRAGNIYVNRSMIGAVVGVQPFGGRGLSGTGPKAGGPHYLTRFATELTVSNNIVASGGNVDLVSQELE
ncbi:MAG: bifunctional proline dehydrogenase/L-glutamate gamma-semialdehyde dehydrogenase PutA [Alphaproteobacteria bacterium]|nr:bifunctional proline dehydrogenase/L-glutamate gamma-semialdehyde dehydrogenase PutA [Alphaproteobacteria bacterium]